MYDTLLLVIGLSALLASLTIENYLLQPCRRTRWDDACEALSFVSVVCLPAAVLVWVLGR